MRRKTTPPTNPTKKYPDKPKQRKRLSAALNCSLLFTLPTLEAVTLSLPPSTGSGSGVGTPGGAQGPRAGPVLTGSAPAVAEGVPGEGGWGTEACDNSGESTEPGQDRRLPLTAPPPPPRAGAGLEPAAAAQGGLRAGPRCGRSLPCSHRPGRARGPRGQPRLGHCTEPVSAARGRGRGSSSGRAGLCPVRPPSPPQPQGLGPPSCFLCWPDVGARRGLVLPGSGC